MNTSNPTSATSPPSTEQSQPVETPPKPFIVSPEGEWTLREELHYDIAPDQFIGSKLSIHAFEVANDDHLRHGHKRQHAPLERWPVCPVPLAPFKYFDVPIQMDPTGLDKGFLCFFRDPNAASSSTASPASTPTNGKKSTPKMKTPSFGKPSPAPTPAAPAQSTPNASPNTVAGALQQAATTNPVPGGAIGPTTNGFPPTSQQNVPQFIQKVVAHEHLSKFLAHARQYGNPSVWINVGKSMVWFDYLCRPKDPWSILYFKDAFPTCHDVARDTMDVVVGFNTGDVLFFSPVSGRFAKMNKASCYTVSTRFSMGTNHPWSSVTSIKWVPGSTTLFWVGFDDGTVLIMDKDKEEAVEPFRVPLELFGISETMTNPPSPRLSKPEVGIASNSLTWAQQETSFVSWSVPNKHKIHAQHYFKVGRKAVTGIEFSPDGMHVAITTLDGLLRIIVLQDLRLRDTFPSYFGGLLTCCWSPDGRFLITGGQDDMLCIYAMPLRSLILRGQGHGSWVTRVKFDQFRWSERIYRIVSVGEDGKVCLWELDVTQLKRPRGTLRKREPGAIIHPLQPRTEIPVVQPISLKLVHSDPLTDLVVREDALVTVCRTAFAKWWDRPVDFGNV